jgi:hypothetical protein
MERCYYFLQVESLQTVGFKFGLLGLGKLGREVIRQSQSKSIRPKFYWIGDSQYFVSRLNRKPFTVNEISKDQNGVF